MFDQLISKFEGFIGTFSTKNLDEKSVDISLASLRTELIEADVNIDIANTLCQDIKHQALETHRVNKLRSEEQVATLVYDAVYRILGTNITNWQAKKNVLMVGLQGSGKTTTTAKLAYFLQNTHDKSINMTSLDIHRPAAMDQLEQLGQEYHLHTTILKDSKIKKIIKTVQKNASQDVMLWDSAGRLSIDDDMLHELSDMVQYLNQPQILLVLDITMGQTALDVAMAFHKAVKVDGIILTKADGDSKGGIALSLKAITNLPILFLGTGEKATDLTPFDNERFARRLLGGGDIVALAEKAKLVIDEEDAKSMEKRMMDGVFTLDDYKKQIESMNKMGGISQIMKLMPSKLQKMSENVAGKMDFSKDIAIINSMTKKERKNPISIHQNRKKRIAKGCGLTLADVNKLMKQYQKMQTSMKQFNKLQKLRPDLVKQFTQ